MTSEVKTKIAAAAKAYIGAKKLTDTAFAGMCGVNKSTLSLILNGAVTYKAGEDELPIPEKHFTAIAKVIKYGLVKSYWPHVETREYEELMYLMKEAKREQMAKMLFIETGAGKSYAMAEFKNEHPQHTYIITMNHDMTVKGMYDDLMQQIGVPLKGSLGWRRSQLIVKLRELKNAGYQPFVGIDEGENMSMRMRASIKGFYDGVFGYVALVVVGTPDLKDIMDDAKAKGVYGGPQLYSRFRMGMKTIRQRENRAERFKPFYAALAEMGMPIERGLQHLLNEVCSDYRILREALEPALRKADAKGVPCDEEFFRLMHDMPKEAAKATPVRVNQLNMAI